MMVTLDVPPQALSPARFYIQPGGTAAKAAATVAWRSLSIGVEASGQVTVPAYMVPDLKAIGCTVTGADPGEIDIRTQLQSCDASELIPWLQDHGVSTAIRTRNPDRSVTSGRMTAEQMRAAALAIFDATHS